MFRKKIVLLFYVRLFNIWPSDCNKNLKNIKTNFNSSGASGKQFCFNFNDLLWTTSVPWAGNGLVKVEVNVVDPSGCSGRRTSSDVVTVTHRKCWIFIMNLLQKLAGTLVKVFFLTSCCYFFKHVFRCKLYFLVNHGDSSSLLKFFHLFDAIISLKNICPLGLIKVN